MRNTTRILHLVLVTACIAALAGTSGATVYPADAAPAGSIIRVTTTGATIGACGGPLWTNACSLQHALNDIAVSGDEIWVKAGTYQPTAGSSPTATFQLKSGVALYGGFATMTETLRSQRNWTTNVTILSGDIGVAGNNSDNSYHVVTTPASVDSTSVLDGFTVTGGKADGGSDDAKGGGMFNNEYSSPTVRNVIFSNNSATGNGGAMHNSSSNPILTNVTFSNNSTTGNGGAMYNDYGSPTLLNVTFDNNSVTGGNGGALYNDLGSTPVLTNVTFYSNTAIMSGQNGGDGGAIYNYATSNYTMTQVTFSGNRAVGDDNPAHGGAMWTSAGSATILNTILWGNTPDQIYNDSSTTTVSYGVVQGGYTGTHVITADPLLGAFGNYGGNIETIPLLPGSSAIDAIPNLTNGCGTTITSDERGFVRPRFMGCDMGAFESRGFQLVNISGDNQSTRVNTAFALPLQVSVIANDAGEPVNGGKILFDAPSSGASASLTPNPAIIANGTVSATATANGIRGAYDVTPWTPGWSSISSFHLRNVAVYYVKPTATGTGSCASWANACALLTALGSAFSGDEVWVAAGTYTPTTSSDPNATFTLTNGVGVYGGFGGITETARSQRNWTAHVTTLNGNLSGGAHSLHVVTANDTYSTTVLDGFTVTGGRGTGQEGGGIFINNGNLTIANCRITDNSAGYGGGVFQEGASGRVDVTNCWIALNTTSNHGGGMYVRGSAALTNTQVLSNTAAGHGGGLHVDSGRADLIGGLFSNNVASTGNGGGVNLNTSVSVSSTQFISNTAGGSGGGLLQWNTGYTVTVSSARFERNRANQDGGALWVRGNATATNMVVINNSASSYGSGVLLKGSSSRFLQTTISHNTGGEGSGVSVTNDGATYSTLALTNTILVSQTVGISVTTGNIATLNGVLWFSNGANTGGAGSVTIQNAFSNDPAFAADGYHLTRNSAAIDHGVNSGVTTDIDGEPRPAGAGYDLGADEFRFKIYLPVVVRQ